MTRVVTCTCVLASTEVERQNDHLSRKLTVAWTNLSQQNLHNVELCQF